MEIIAKVAIALYNLLKDVADLKYEFDFVMLNVAKRNEASTEILRSTSLRSE